MERSYASCSLHLEEGESWYPFNVSVCLSVCHNRKAFEKKKITEKKGGWFAVGAEGAASVSCTQWRGGPFFCDMCHSPKKRRAAGLPTDHACNGKKFKNSLCASGLCAVTLTLSCTLRNPPRTEHTRAAAVTPVRPVPRRSRRRRGF